ncbi:MAG TPA: CCA tRNA nucleotidyltransferase [Kiritimatiellia bacterium]|nr:CCA tRNA nucleotidyltransferase [Kiritimatiellia bacterium]HMP96622.1 CCA tRNA nucleotidyltransferase [Kiritimatiellia bacterium]
MTADGRVFAPPHPPPSTPLLQAAESVAARLREGGHVAYFAGGFARDTLLRRPIHDIDIATDARPDAVQRLFAKSRAIGKSFGVIQVEYNDHVFEVATFRRDLGYQDGRHPSEVEFTREEEDAQRRDFTVNGMFYDPTGPVIRDYVGGSADMEHRCLRAIGDPEARFSEDHLRIMRAIRFASVLEFTIEPDTWEAVRRHAVTLRAISMERIRDEWVRTLMEAPQPGAALRRFHASGILAVILPEIEAMIGVEQPPEFHPEGDVFVHTCLMLDQMVERTPTLIWSILLHDVAKPRTFAIGTDKEGRPRIQFRGHAELGAEMAATIMKRFRCSNEEIDAVVGAVLRHMRFSAVPEMRNATLRRWVGGPSFPLELELHRIDCLASHGSLDHYHQVLAFQEKLAQEPVLPTAWLSGRDLIAEGIAPGPAMGRMLKWLYDAQLEGKFQDRDSALAWLRAHRDELAGMSEETAGSTDVDKPSVAPRVNHDQG